MARVIPSRVTTPAVLPSRVQLGVPAPVVAVPRRQVPPRVILQKGPGLGLEHVGRQGQRIQQSLASATEIARSNPFAACNNLEGLSLSSGANFVQHGLGRAWTNALLHSQSASITWHFSNSAAHPASAWIIVTVSASCTANLLVS